MNIRLKTLLSLGAASLVTMSYAFPVHAASKETCMHKIQHCHKREHITVYVNGKKCTVSTKPSCSHITIGCHKPSMKPVCKPVLPTEKPVVKPDENTQIPSTKPVEKPVTKPNEDV